MAKKSTTFQKLERAITGNWGDITPSAHVNSYDMSNGSEILFRTHDKDKYEQAKLELGQNKYIKNMWRKANVDLTVSAFSNLNYIQLMYRDADLMDAFPEIGAALDTVSEESSLSNECGSVVAVYSKSDRIRSILEDLFVNRLNLQIMAPMVIRAMCKYGNQFMLLDIDNKLGVKGWRQLPVFDVERIENGIQNPYAQGGASLAANTTEASDIDMSTSFIWNSHGNSQVAFRNWQIAHFRLLNNSMYLPYGASLLNSARRHFRMLSLMEDMMFIYRLERSMERRVYKIYVGGIDDADVEAYVEQIANQFKRTPIVDPMTGQIDLRKNVLPVHKDTPIPLLDGRTITIEELAKEYEQGKDNFVYSVQDNTHKIVPGHVVWCGKNYTADELVKLTLDDDTYMVMAKEHEIIMRDGSKKRADEVSVGESVMPFYRKIDKNSKKLFERYERVYNPNTGKYDFTHRLMAEAVEKEHEEFNTVHHKDFNKYNNNPTNLVWMDYNEHHKMHGDLARKMWEDPIKRASIVSKLSKISKGRKISDQTKSKISKTLIKKFKNGELDHVKIQSSKSLTEYNKSLKHIEEAKERGLKLGYRSDFRAYNQSELHKQHDEIRRMVNTERWMDSEKRAIYKSNMTVKFDNYVWDEIRKNILNGRITTQNKLIEFINENLIDYLISTNSTKKLQHYKKVTKPLVKARIVEKGFSDFRDYYLSIKKNHKIKSIEIIGGDDVYCMTVVGPNGEEDRHNFALCTVNSDSSWSQNGVFVSNCVDQDIFIPTRSENAPTPIDTLSAGQNLTAMDDIKYVQNKLATALRVPKAFMNFEETAGDGKNLALMDIRFTRIINHIQQAFLMELTKIASIHLYLLGFSDDITNFSLTMKNPSTQAEQLEIENLSKKIAACRDAISDPGGGIPIMSQMRALKEIMKWSEKDIKENLEEIRLERAIAAELEKTTQIIKRTNIFDNVDRIYGEPGAEYVEDQQGGQGGEDGPDGMMGGGPSGGSFGGGLDDLGAPGAQDEGMINGQEGTEPTGEMGGNGEGEMPPPPPQGGPNESIKPDNMNMLFEEYIKKVNRNPEKDRVAVSRTDIFNKSLMINEEFTSMIDSLDGFIEK